MDKNFWLQLKKPFFILAPMADVTDMAFRQVIVEISKPDVLYTEFVSCDGLCGTNAEVSGTDAEKTRRRLGREKLLKHLKFGENERPIVAQFFGSKPENFYTCAKLAVELGFDGIDINMGCPAGKIVKQDSGAGLILNPALAQEIIRETKRGIIESLQARPVYRSGLLDCPVSVKTRIGYNTIETERWISQLIEAQPVAITIHGRTMKEMSKVPAHWDEIGKAAKLCHGAGILCIGNGDVMSYAEGLEKAKQYNLDGIMVGRGIFHNPWFFSAEGGSSSGGNPIDKTPQEKIALLCRHVELFTELWGATKQFGKMKRFFKVYMTGFDGAKELREQLMACNSASEVYTVLGTYHSLLEKNII